MNTRLFVLLSLASASACAIFVGACSSNDSTALDGGDDATTSDVGSTPDTGTPNDTGTPSDTGTTPDTGGNGMCADAGQGCRGCCVAAFPDAEAFVIANEENCACTTPGDCKQQCNNSLCTGKPASGQCTQCLRSDAGNCAAGAVAACVADPGCKPLEQCLLGCPNTGPTLDAGGPG